MNENLVIGIGNPILTDDGIGPFVVRKLQDKFENQNIPFDFKINYTSGIDLLLELVGYKRVLIIDSIKCYSEKPGSCYFMKIDELNDFKFSGFLNTHGVNFTSLWELGKKLKLEMPADCHLFGIVAGDCTSFGENFTAGISLNIEKIVAEIINHILSWDVWKLLT